MKESDVRARAFAMPLTSPAFPPGPYRFRRWEYLIIAYRTDPDKLRALVPEPLEVAEPVVKYEFVRMPDSTGFGDYTETGQVVPVSFRGRKGGYSHYLFRRTRALGLSKEIGTTVSARRNRHAGWHTWLVPCGWRPALWVTSTRRPITPRSKRRSKHPISS
jgi:hypothetical protein